eukprot:GEMP01019617.1.p1 GENE.GEMP01019617.1~~GEMP01019617.1.p1  ORF type:complete len:397 (+),score=60.57 GEMP01019617.1:85-1275(+)
MGAIESLFDSPILDLCYGKKGPMFDFPVTSKEKSEGSSDERSMHRISEFPNRILVWPPAPVRATARKNTTVTYGSASMQGWRLRNEDAHICIPQLIEDDPDSPALFGIMDGHGGKGVARLTATKLPDILRKSPFFARRDYEIALRSAFLEMDAFLSTPEGRQQVTKLDLDEVEGEVAEQINVPHKLDFSGPDLQGCTCCIALIVPGNDTNFPKVFCANAGDSRCIFGADNLCVGLSDDHKPDLHEEEERVVSAGGCVIRDILGGPRINGGLNVSRAFGDFQYKMKKGLRPHQQMISPMPDIKQHTWLSNDDVSNSFLLLACDGIWDRNSNEAAVKFVSERLKKKSLATICADLCDATIATQRDRQSTNLAIRYTGQDNMTCVIVKPTEALWARQKK